MQSKKQQEPMNLYMFSLLNGFDINCEAILGARSILRKMDDFSCEGFVQIKRSATWPRLASQNDCDDYLAAFLDIDVTKIMHYSSKLRPRCFSLL